MSVPMKPGDPPRPTGKPPVLLSLVGMIMPAFRDNAVAFIGVDGLGHAVPLFTSKAAFERLLATFPLEHDKLTQVTDTSEFLSDVPPEVPIVIDIHRSERGTYIYKEVRR